MEKQNYAEKITYLQHYGGKDHEYTRDRLRVTSDSYGYGYRILDLKAKYSFVMVDGEVQEYDGPIILWQGPTRKEAVEAKKQILEEGNADLIAIGRRLMADPELPNKAAGGRLNEVNPCIACMECNERPRKPGEGTACTVNAVMGHEGEYVIRPVKKILRIPEEVTPLGMAYIGYPADVPSPHTHYDDYRVYWQHYEPRKRRAKKKDAKHNVD